MQSFVAVTDAGWLRTLRLANAREVNFWQPRPTTVTHALGMPWIFKVRGTKLIGGYGFFSYYTIMPLSIAWETFTSANGVTSVAEMESRVKALRRADSENEDVGCVVLSDVHVLPERKWLAAPADWHPNIVRGAGYDLTVGEGKRIWNELLAVTAPRPDLATSVSAIGRYGTPAFAAARRGQGAFRLMVMDAYGRRCAVTGERTLPVLEAAHIRPFAAEQTHEVRNGLLLRSDLHKLYDRGLVTVDPDLRFQVSSRIERDYSNGKIYYALEGRHIAEPHRDELKPDRVALDWHAREIFKP